MATYTITWERKSMHHWPHCYPCNIYVLRDNLPESLIHPPCRAPPPPPLSPSLLNPKIPSYSSTINYLYLLLVNFQRLVHVNKCILSLFKMSEREVFTQVTGFARQYRGYLKLQRRYQVINCFFFRPRMISIWLQKYPSNQ